MKEVYFEQQAPLSLLCGMHSVNNLLGNHVYSRDALNSICYSLSDDFINPHKHVFGGQYDVNVLIIALQQKNCHIHWADHRKPFEIEQYHEGQPLLGFLVNVFLEPTCSAINKLFGISNRHWIAVRRVEDHYWVLDSQQQPEMKSAAVMQEKIQAMMKERERDGERTEVIAVFGHIQKIEKK